TASQRFFLAASSSLKLLTTSAANRRIPQNGTLILRLSVVPPVIIQKTKGVVRGCFARVTYKGNSVDCMIGDVGPHKKIGEISIAAARAVGMPSSPRSGGEDKKIVQYEIFPGRKATINGVTYPLMRSDGTYVD